MKDRSHTYLYSVEVRKVTPATTTTPKVETWEPAQVAACAMWEAAHKLNQKEDDVRFIDKRIL